MRNGSVMRLFVYGSLVDRARLEEVIGHRHDGEVLRAQVVGFRRVEVPTYGYPFLVAAPEEEAHGLLVTDLSTADIDALDAYEDVPSGLYERIQVEVEAWGCGPRSWTME